ncbi:MAG: glycosyltransferase family 4 protein [Dethiobacter sp.]|nr:glycosyltransferase family 4 protein [Dethiobacter sp.]
MRVLVLSWEFPPRIVGGLARHVHDLTVALADNGVEVAVITTSENGGREFETMHGVDIYRVKPYYLVPRDFISGILQLNTAMLEKVMELLRRGETYDLIHAHDWLVAFAARAIKHSERIPLVATIHATEYGRNRGLHNDEQRYISDVEWWLTYEAWNVICCSRYMRHELQRVFQLPTDKISMVPNGVDPRQFRAGRNDPGMRARYVGPKEKIVFFVGRLVQEKGVHVLLDAVPRILASVPATKFIIAGKGPALEHLRNHARHLGIEQRVHFTGYIDDVTRNSLYNVSSVAVFPSLYEPFGIVALEAMAARVPVVVADTGGLSEIVDHGVDGLKCYAGNATSLADQVVALLSDTNFAGRLSANAYQKVNTHFSWQEIARQTMNIYHDVLADYKQSNWTRKQEAETEIYRHAQREALFDGTLRPH